MPGPTTEAVSEDLEYRVARLKGQVAGLALIAKAALVVALVAVFAAAWAVGWAASRPATASAALSR